MRFSFLVLFLFTVHGIGTAQTVYKTPSGKKYHTATCRYVKNVSHKLSIKEARSNRLGPCSQCKPDQPSSSTLRSSAKLGIQKNEVQGSRSTAVQCKGVTKAQKRCRRKTKNINGYCFQHEGG
ncbi:DUF5763 domain-containing protein [Membranihabitans marinus]|uniref:DUF5763 domain-containing protein n=1 Tax=Membranihabitans marinus TaxID=1227546 RepID=UPI001C9982EC